MELAALPAATLSRPESRNGDGIMISSTAYRPVGALRGGADSPAYFFMIDHLLSSRRESGFPSNAVVFDEDVNVYLAALLTSYIFGGAPSGPERIFPYDLPLFEAAARETDPRGRFCLYRANADHLLLQVGIFDNPRSRRPGSASHMDITREAYIGRGKSYYRMAWASAAETFRRPTAIGDIMGKLSGGFERYVEILSVMRGEYLNMIPRLSDGELFHLGRDVFEEDRKREIAALYDGFLDAWSAWRRSGGQDRLGELETAAERLTAADPSFSFDLPENADPR
jgi:hypothetical protein